jgi:hypothetical protein
LDVIKADNSQYRRELEIVKAYNSQFKRELDRVKADNSQSIREHETVTATLREEEIKRIAQETKFDTCQSTALANANAIMESSRQFETFKCHSDNIVAVLRRALATEKYHRYRVEKQTKRLGETQAEFESDIRRAVTNIQDNLREDKLIHERTVDNWSEAVSLLEKKSANATRSVCTVAGEQAHACTGQKTDQTGMYRNLCIQIRYDKIKKSKDESTAERTQHRE